MNAVMGSVAEQVQFYRKVLKAIEKLEFERKKIAEVRQRNTYVCNKKGDTKDVSDLRDDEVLAIWAVENK